MDILHNRETNFQCMIPIDYLRLYKGAVYKILGVSGDSNGTYFQLEYDAGYIYISFAVAYKTGTESVYRLTGRIFGIFN